MKLVQKTLLATAVAVACSGSAFADVTLSGKVALEVVGSQNAGNVKDRNNTEFLSDGLSFDIKGAYDIIGNSQAGFKIATVMNKSTWTQGANLTVDQANVFFKGGWGKLAMGYLSTPSDGVAVDYFDNTNFAASFINTAAGDVKNAVAYSFEGESFSVAAAVAAGSGAVQNNSKHNGINNGHVDSSILVSDIAASFKVMEAVTVKAGYQHKGTHKAVPEEADKALAGFGSLSVEGDFDAFGAALTVTGYNERVNGKAKQVTDLAVGGKYNVNDLITVKAQVALQDLGDTNKSKTTPKQYGIGADFNLAKNVQAFAAVSITDLDVDSKTSAAETAFGTGVTVKF